MQQSDWLMKCKDIMIETLHSQQSKKALIMVCTLLHSHESLNENSVNIIACFQRICLILQTINNRGNEKYILVLIQCHDEIITNSIVFFCDLHSSSTHARPNSIISFVKIAS